MRNKQVGLNELTERQIIELCSLPLFFKKNRVYRVYTGGAQFAELCGDNSSDGSFPEEWIASSVRAINPKYFGSRDGVSQIENTDIFFDDLLAAHAELLLGGRKYDCLVKFLDSAVRLPVQVHPDKEFSKRKFGSDYGKTEAWLVLATRENAKLYFGFNTAVSKRELSRLEERSLADKHAMASVLASVDVEPGDVYLIRAGLIHAIGAGCTILEVQEPTDFTIQPENWCGNYKISENEKYIGLTKSEALDCFDYSLYGEKALRSATISPKTEYETNGVKKEILISYADTECFAENRFTLKNGCIKLGFAPAVWIVLEGKITLSAEGYNRELNKGEYFFLPYAAQDKIKASGTGVLIECLPSRQT